MRDPAAGDRVRRRLHHRVLADQFGEALWPIFAGEDAICRPGGLDWLGLGRRCLCCDLCSGRGRRLFGEIAEHRRLPFCFKLGCSRNFLFFGLFV